MGLSNTDAIALAGIDDSTFYKWLKRGGAEAARLAAHPKAAPRDRETPFVQFFQYIKGAIPRRKMKLLGTIHTATVDNWTAAAWLLERLHPDEFARRETVRNEVTGADGGPVVIDDSGITDDERAARLAVIFERARIRAKGNEQSGTNAASPVPDAERTGGGGSTVGQAPGVVAAAGAADVSLREPGA